MSKVHWDKCWLDKAALKFESFISVGTVDEPDK